MVTVPLNCRENDFFKKAFGAMRAPFLLFRSSFGYRVVVFFFLEKKNQKFKKEMIYGTFLSLFFNGLLHYSELSI